MIILFQVIIHSPIESPPLYNSFFLRPSTYNVILATPEMVTVSEELRCWSPFARGCYFHNEKFLRFFKVYTLANCDLECRANKTRRLCGCAAFGHPSKYISYFLNLHRSSMLSKNTSYSAYIDGNFNVSMCKACEYLSRMLRMFATDIANTQPNNHARSCVSAPI